MGSLAMLACNFCSGDGPSTADEAHDVEKSRRIKRRSVVKAKQPCVISCCRGTDVAIAEALSDELERKLWFVETKKRSPSDGVVTAPVDGRRKDSAIVHPLATTGQSAPRGRAREGAKPGPAERRRSPSDGVVTAPVDGRRKDSAIVHPLATTGQSAPRGRAREGAKPGPAERRRSPSDGVVTAPVDGRRKDSTNVHPLATTGGSATKAAPAAAAETWFPPGGYNTQCKLPARITSADRRSPASLEAFLKSTVGSAVGSASSRRVVDNLWAEIVESKARRQRYLRDYCPFQREGEEEEEQEKRSPEKNMEPAELDHTEVELPADCPESQGGDTTGVRDKRPVRGTLEYYAMRREFLKSYQFATSRTRRENAPGSWRKLASYLEKFKFPSYLNQTRP
ncbi:hypothetical protein ABZP36_019493 [Zizania latifolia]